ncbi:conserved hypothetical protein [Pseudoalteromonas sp. 3J6]|uniref:hypothetical protein n=1 Tax=Pseudoalteromonas sp. 3J6 TaxID=649161 RepID=UPI001755CBA6|nr:hypothetical protein [Pseudoalteromonas sp. 3J6]CAD2224836.1 conserved hypothetical protein [Pseudoalteromonas sp. 3J6]
MEALYTYPSYLDDFVERLIERGWLVHNFDNVADSEIYNFSNYLYNKQENGVTYTIYLDLNIYQFILNAFKKSNPKQEFRDAIALVVFCQFTEIELDPTYAVYEKVNYRKDDEILDEVVSDLELFHRINNINNSSMVEFASGDINTIIPAESYAINPNVIKQNLTKYRRLCEWDSLYLIVVYVIYVAQLPSLSKLDKLTKVVEWMIAEFRLSLVGITFAAIYFSGNPMKRMMKYKVLDDPLTKQRSAFNMTWDLYNLNRYFRMWTERVPEQEGMFASGDKVFNAVLRKSIKVQQTSCLDCFQGFLPEDIVRYLEKITSKPNEHFDRVYDSPDWAPAYREELIRKYEALTGIEHSGT